MSFALQPFEPLTVGIRRLLDEQLAGVVLHLLAQADPATDRADPVESVHEARKCLKRSRTLVRLLRRALGRSQAQAINVRLGAVAGRLSSYRDQHMLQEALDRLAKQTASSPFAEALPPIQAALRRRQSVQPIAEDLLGWIVTEVRAIAAALQQELLPLREGSLRTSLQAGLRRMLRRGQRAYFLAYSEPSDEHFHDWRKRVKDVYYTACLLHPTRPQKLAVWVDSLDPLSEDLGDEHDLGILAKALASQPIGDEAATALTLRLIARRREDLRATARMGGEVLYQRSAKAASRFLTRGLMANKSAAKPSPRRRLPIH